MKRLFLLTCAMFLCNLMNAQILYQQTAPGAFNYNSLYQPSDLHFYLYGDGYHSFEADNQHEFGENANGNTVVAYHSEPYDVDQVDQLVLNTITDGIALPTIPNYAMPNKVALKRSWELVNDEDNFFILMFENRESPNPISGCIEFHFNTSDSDIAGSTILDDYENDWVDPNQILATSEYSGYSNKFTWTFTDLKENEQRLIYIPADCLADALEFVNTMAVMKVDDCNERLKPDENGDGANPWNDQSPYFTLRSQVKNFPHDPNAIVTDPNCLTKRDKKHTVRYKIYFQNIGEDPVEDVILDFSLNTPFHSIELIEASSNCQMQWNPQLNPYAYSEHVRFEFPDIYLDGLADDPPPKYEDTYGWVIFDVCFNMNIFSQLQINCAESNVDIYFDEEAPVSSTNSICRNCEYLASLTPTPLQYYDCPEILPAIQKFEVPGDEHLKITSVDELDEKSNDDISVYPNPVNNMLFLDIKNLEKNDIINIRDMSGKIVKNLSLNTISKGIDLSNFPAGVYYISLQNEKSVITKSFVKI